MPYQTKQPGYTPEDGTFVVESPITPEQLLRLQEIGNNFMKRYMDQCWIENDASGFTGWRWDRYKVKLIIVAAANRYKDIVVIGPRHYSNGMNLAVDALGGTDLLHTYAGDDVEQGFVDQYSTFYNRKEAWVLAETNDQIRYRKDLPVGTLYSEHLY